MFDGHHAMWGMHWGWWLFSLLGLVALLFIAVLFLKPHGSRPKVADRQSPESSTEILERRYAAGEISTEEYRERKSALDGSRG
jgi:putative membrane protein